MRERLTHLRFSRLQLAVLAGLSVLASVFLIVSADGRTPAQTAALAALRQRPLEYRVVEPAPVTAAPAVSSDDDSTDDSSDDDSAPASSSDDSTSDDTTASSTSSDSDTDSSTATTPSTSATTSQPAAKSKIGHVFVIALSTPSYDAAFGAGSVAHYLNGRLRKHGTLLRDYQSLSTGELPDYLAMIGGQGPNPDTSAGCSTYAEFPTGASPASDGVVGGTGCVYPNTVLTIGDQVTAAGHAWKGYVEGMPSACVHPNSDASDPPPSPDATDQYDDRHNPFIYYHSLLDIGGCQSDDVPITQLPKALHKASKTPTYSYIAPDACLDASAATCPDNQPAGLAGEDAFLKQWVPKLLSSPAFRDNGMLIVAFALSPPAAGQPAPSAMASGALVLSPYTAHNKTIGTAYNAYSLLHSVESLLGYKALGHAAAAKSFASRVVSATKK